MAFVAAACNTREMGTGHVALAGWRGPVPSEAVAAEAAQFVLHPGERERRRVSRVPAAAPRDAERRAHQIAAQNVERQVPGRVPLEGVWGFTRLVHEAAFEAGSRRRRWWRRRRGWRRRRRRVAFACVAGPEKPAPLPRVHRDVVLVEHLLRQMPRDVLLVRLLGF